MAVHQTYALNYLPGASDNRFWEKSGNYPPFVHIVIAIAYWFLHPGPHVAILANVPATILLLWGVYEMGLAFAGTRAAVWACILTTLTPFLIWISRETLLDYWLAAWVAAGLALLLKTSGFEAGRYSFLFGVACALGMLTKWFFAGFIVVPIAYIIVRHEIWTSTRRMMNCVAAFAIAGFGAGIWYFPNLLKLVRYFFENAQIGAREGEPPVLSFQSFIYYLRLLEGYQFFALLFCLIIVSVLFAYKDRILNGGGYLAVAIVGGWLAMTLLRTKDPRFTMPLLGPMTVVMAAWITTWKRGWISYTGKAVLLILLCTQAYAINFGLRWLPRQVVLLEGYQGQLRWDWNLYLQDYFGISGPPKREDWKQDSILRRVVDDSSGKRFRTTLGLVPDLPRFNATNFNLFARLRGLPVEAGHPQSAVSGIHSFDAFNYALLIEGDQGWAYTTAENLKLNEIVLNHRETFHFLDSYPLPSGGVARLYAVR
ncbi:MAG: hypothetical protein AUI36_44315 [Cyanobacteria bacterium 13_1_40CM_2_61_4]|nr:MAG: hypothetical protein AUI36_44315 [Cyanobacteria bacterium 13_1_40CM_2_61_4]